MQIVHTIFPFRQKAASSENSTRQLQIACKEEENAIGKWQHCRKEEEKWTEDPIVQSREEREKANTASIVSSAIATIRRIFPK